MRRILACVLVVMIAACGGDPVEAAENCSQLSRAAEDVVAEAGEDQQRLEEIAAKVESRAIELAEAAIARGAELEAAICGEAAIHAGAAAVEEVFTSVGDASESDG